MERPNAWKAYDDAALAELEQLCGDYRAFISQNKTERECVTASVALAEAAGYVNLEDAVAEGRALKPGDKVYAVNHKKTLMLVNLGTAPLEEGVNILVRISTARDSISSRTRCTRPAIWPTSTPTTTAA